MLRRVAGLNVLLVVAAVALTVVVLAPGKLSSFAVDEEVALVVAAVAVVVLANVYMLRRIVGPAIPRQVGDPQAGPRGVANRRLRGRRLPAPPLAACLEHLEMHISPHPNAGSPSRHFGHPPRHNHT